MKPVSSAQHARQTCNMREEYFFLFVVYYKTWNSLLITVATFLVITFFGPICDLWLLSFLVTESCSVF